MWTISKDYVNDDEPLEFDDVYGPEPDDAWEVHLTMLDIERSINELDVKCGAGTDNISLVVFKKCVDVFVWPLWILY